MLGYIAALTMVLLVAMVLLRVVLLKRMGIQAMNFGRLDKTDFLIPPFALIYFYLVFAQAFGWPTVSRQGFFHSEPVAWIGAFLCLVGLLFFLWALVSFGRSFRVGIDEWHPGTLVTSGAFAFSRNPIYTAFALILLGQFLIFPNVILLIYALAGTWLFHRQVLREEEFLKRQYGTEFLEYSGRVRRYI